MTQESIPELHDLPPMPLNPPQLSRTFSNYDDPDTKLVEQWLYYGGAQPADESIQNGFPILYNQVYCVGFHGQPHWTPTFHFTDTRTQRWEVMESIAGVQPIMDAYQRINCRANRK